MLGVFIMKEINPADLEPSFLTYNQMRQKDTLPLRLREWRTALQNGETIIEGNCWIDELLYSYDITKVRDNLHTLQVELHDFMNPHNNCVLLTLYIYNWFVPDKLSIHMTYYKERSDIWEEDWREHLAGLRYNIGGARLQSIYAKTINNVIDVSDTEIEVNGGGNWRNDKPMWFGYMTNPRAKEDWIHADDCWECVSNPKVIRNLTPSMLVAKYGGISSDTLRTSHCGQTKKALKDFDEQVKSLSFEELKRLYIGYDITSKTILNAYGGYLLPYFLGQCLAYAYTDIFGKVLRKVEPEDPLSFCLNWIKLMRKANKAHNMNLNGIRLLTYLNNSGGYIYRFNWLGNCGAWRVTPVEHVYACIDWARIPKETECLEL